MSSRIIVTGMGVVSALGWDADRDLASYGSRL